MGPGRPHIICREAPRRKRWPPPPKKKRAAPASWLERLMAFLRMARRR
jgi:hypothetical protein